MKIGENNIFQDFWDVYVIHFFFDEWHILKFNGIKLFVLILMGVLAVFGGIIGAGYLVSTLRGH
jgi:hypothetical protein